MPQPLIELGGSGPLASSSLLIHLAVANGFPPGSYGPLAAQLCADYRVVSLPPRALWPDQAAIEKPSAWSVLADDLLDGLVQQGLTDVIAVGHSFGALATIMAAGRDPGRFAALVLLDPTILPAHVLALIAQAQQQGIADQLPLAAGARRRHTAFAGQQEAFDYWRAKPLFHDWSDDALWAYTRSMLQSTPDGSGMTLAWPPDWEAHYYETIETQPWPFVGVLAETALPVLVIRGAETDTFTEEPADRMQEMLPAAEFHTIPDAGHLFPLVAPEATAAVIRDWLARIER